MRALDDGAVAAAAWEELGRHVTPADPLVQLVAASPAPAPGSIGHAWLHARVLDRSGEAAAAVELLEAAVDGTCRHGPALVDLAGFRADRGDAVGRVAAAPAGRCRAGA